MENGPPKKAKISPLLYAAAGLIGSGLFSAYTGYMPVREGSHPRSGGDSILTILVGTLLFALYFISDRFPGTYRDLKTDYHTVEYDFAEQFIRHVAEQMYSVECFIFEQEMLCDQIPFKRIEYPEIRARGPALVFEKSDETLLVIELFHLANGKYINSDEVIVEREHQQYYLRLVPISEALQFRQITE
jgi:hypothetical protein